MPKNALGPKPSTGSFFDPSTVYDFLNSQGVLPAWSQTRPYDDVSSGTYTRNANTIVGLPPSPSNTAASTIAHEMTHASQALINSAASAIREKQWQKQSLSPAEQQFLQVYLKTMGELPGRAVQYGKDGDDRGNAFARIKDTVNALTKNSKMSESYKSYRTSPKELQAWGVGQSIEGAPSFGDQPLHLNPSFATEFAILMDTYNRLPSLTRQQAVRNRIDQFEKRTGQVDEAQYAPPVTNYPNPFKTR